MGIIETGLSRVIEDPKAAVQPDFRLAVKFELKHPALVVGQTVRVRFHGEVVFEEVVEMEGRMRLGIDALVAEIKDPAAGQRVSVEVAGTELFSEPLRRD